MVFESEYSLVEFKFLITNLAVENFCKLLVAINQLSVIRILQSITFNVLP